MGALLRWLACGFIALGMHTAIVLAIASHSDDSALDTGASVVMMELAPISTAPLAALSELAPGPQQGEAEQIEQVKQEAPKDQQDAEQMPELPRNPILSSRCSPAQRCSRSRRPRPSPGRRPKPKPRRKYTRRLLRLLFRVLF